MEPTLSEVPEETDTAPSPPEKVTVRVHPADDCCQEGVRFRALLVRVAAVACHPVEEGRDALQAEKCLLAEVIALTREFQDV